MNIQSKGIKIRVETEERTDIYFALNTKYHQTNAIIYDYIKYYNTNSIYCALVKIK